MQRTRAGRAHPMGASLAWHLDGGAAACCSCRTCCRWPKCRPVRPPHIINGTNISVDVDASVELDHGDAHPRAIELQTFTVKMLRVLWVPLDLSCQWGQCMTMWPLSGLFLQIQALTLSTNRLRMTQVPNQKPYRRQVSRDDLIRLDSLHKPVCTQLMTYVRTPLCQNQKSPQCCDGEHEWSVHIFYN